MSISLKQQKILAFPYSKRYQALICDGSVRSGKTSIMTIAFVDWAMRDFDNANFAICGKTVGSAIRNIITPYISLTYRRDRYIISFTRSDNKMVVRCGKKVNTFYVFGGKDESSAALIQGATLAGLLLDEVALMTRSFVEQALARCSVDGAKFWFNCNPESPQHWFYTEWIKQAEKHKALHLHFIMTDNPSLSAETLERYENMYSGVFYDRYVRGMWVVAEGLVYSMFNRDFHVVPVIPRPYEQYYISVDYGTQNPCAFLLWGLADDVHYLVKEYYHSGRETNNQKTDEEYYTELEKFAGRLSIERIIIDPSAASFITLIRRKGRFGVRKADNAVLDGIRETATALKKGLLKFNECCADTIREFGLYSWDEKSSEDKPIKDNDHAMDAMRYYVKTLKIAVPKRKSLLEGW